MHAKDTEGIANSVDPALFAKTSLSKNLGKLRYLQTDHADTKL